MLDLVDTACAPWPSPCSTEVTTSNQRAPEGRGSASRAVLDSLAGSDLLAHSFVCAWLALSPAPATANPAYILPLQRQQRRGQSIKTPTRLRFIAARLLDFFFTLGGLWVPLRNVVWPDLTRPSLTCAALVELSAGCFSQALSHPLLCLLCCIAVECYTAIGHFCSSCLLLLLSMALHQS